MGSGAKGAVGAGFAAARVGNTTLCSCTISCNPTLGSSTGGAGRTTLCCCTAGGATTAKGGTGKGGAGKGSTSGGAGA